MKVHRIPNEISNESALDWQWKRMRKQAISNENYEIDNEKGLLLNEIHHTYGLWKEFMALWEWKVASLIWDFS